MTPQPPAISITAELREHASALRALAADLLRSPDRAEDAVQETMLRAWRSPPRQQRGMLPWLSTVLRRVASNERRSDARRRTREATAASLATSTAGVPANPTSGANDAIHRVTMALQSLDEPYRGVLTQRYFTGLSPTEIASRSNAPVATIKSQLQRGLARIRQQLDADRGEGGNWRAGLTAALGLRLVRKSAPALLLPAVGKWIAGIAVAASVTFATWWLLQDRSATPIAETEVAVPQLATARIVGHGDYAADRAPQSVRTPAATAAPKIELGHDYTFAVECLTVDAHGIPVDAALAIGLEGTAMNTGLDERIGAGRRRLTFSASTPRVRVRLGAQFRGVGKSLLELDLSAGVTLERTFLVEDAESGRPCSVGQQAATANCTICHIRDAGSPSVFDVRGFAEPGMHPSSLLVETLPDTVEIAPGPSLKIIAPRDGGSQNGLGQDSENELPRLRGIVRGVHGEPVPFARVVWGRAGNMPTKSIRAEKDGTFALERIWTGDLDVRAGGGKHGIASQRMLVHEQTDAHIEFTLDPQQSLAGTVLLSEGASPELWRVQWHAHDRSWADGVRIGPDGAFRLANLPDASGELLLWTASSRLPVGRMPTVATGTDVCFDLRKQELPTGKLTVAVVLPGANSEPADSPPAPGTAASNGVDVFVTHEESGRCAQMSGGGGVFAIAQLGPGFYRVVALTAGGAPMNLGRHWCDGRSTLDLGTRTLPANGQLQLPDGVVANAEDVEIFVQRANTDVRLRTPQAWSNLPLPPGDFLLVRRGLDKPTVVRFAIEADARTDLTTWR
ncbi:MAG: RNA polymerase sigma factor [Planctomycetota bacterium]